MKKPYVLGQEAEQKALAYLLSKGYLLLEKNFRYRKAEIDLILQKDDFLVVVEVKARSTQYFGAAETFVSPKKIELLVMATDYYIQKNQLNLEVRFDIVAFHVDGIHWKQTHLKNAFYFF